MDVQITIRRRRATEAFRSAVEEKARKLEKFEPRLSRVELLFDEDGGRAVAEVRALVPGVPVLVARADGETRRAVLDRVLRKAGRQLRKERSKRVDHQAMPVAAILD